MASGQVASGQQGLDVRWGREWMTAEIRELLAAIEGEHAAKMRVTVIRLAFARAYQLPLAEVFRAGNTCNQRIWYQKWQYIPEVRAALEACVERAMEWVDEETAALEAQARRELRRNVATVAPEAPGALAAVMRDGEQSGGNRIEAARELRKWLLAPESAGDGAAALPVRVTEIDAEIERELARLAGRSEGGDVEPAAGAADAGGS